eukprot:Gregarina_sp_Poly_1__4145@NODE_226_length_11195_cov_150_303648_g200_i0_p6_GENE_NODE_226_length_11195_cov_150_303648_g200_i0NODE_226_length_11195_cov_150_303648_g200_i0_p6_ORF_typecomplete_len237_score15_57ABC_tran/PF00005_27/4_4e16AAA_15/PF13175_6/0_083AAA_15/PF13175_6/0_53AAA_21/PF13304_6/0_00011RsgA_GTPase/PF03193_16/0_00012AAA_16/PF13191_6/0_00029SMC_N/PF02463_19/0_088SMC_N/PF02463_19/8_2MMR_HSR1/PF01926_23/0_0022Pox_A32/PF04665_12/0_011Pox_A32/PF04665_12/1_1e03AAA_29/PF13555_6/0_0063Rad17/PF
MDSAPGIIVNNLRFRLNPRHAKTPGQGIHWIGPVCAHFLPGRITGVLGPSGCGKTALLNALTGTISVRDFRYGSITVYDERGKYRSLHEYQTAVGKQTRFIPSSDIFPPAMKVKDILTAAVLLRKHTRTTDPLRIVTRVAQQCYLTHVLGMRLDTLTAQADASRGERKRVSIAKELCSVERGALGCMFLDEPTMCLDTALAIQLFQLFRSLVATGAIGTMIATLHQPTPLVIGLLS